MLKKLQRSNGSINIEFYNNQLKKLFQSGCSKILNPNSYNENNELVFINTAGGITCNDNLEAKINLVNSHPSDFQATHAWAEFYIQNLGWIGFDPTNNCCPDERYIRVSCGLDASYASPIRGIFYGHSNQDNVIENLNINVETQENSSQQ